MQDFPGSNAGASLKPDSLAEAPQVAGGDFPGSNAGASLKPDIGMLELSLASSLPRQ